MLLRAAACRAELIDLIDFGFSQCVGVNQCSILAARDLNAGKDRLAVSMHLSKVVEIAGTCKSLRPATLLFTPSVPDAFGDEGRFAPKHLPGSDDASQPLKIAISLDVIAPKGRRAETL